MTYTPVEIRHVRLPRRLLGYRVSATKKLLDLVGKVCALAPHVLEARRDLREQAVRLRAVVAHEAGARCHVSDLNRCERHRSSPLKWNCSRIRMTTPAKSQSTMVAIGSLYLIRWLVNGVVLDRLH